MNSRLFILLIFTAFAFRVVDGQEKPVPPPPNLDAEQLVAWCIVPFDAKKRNPAERAAMLASLGLRRCAYDWRNEHIPHFEEEIRQYQKHGIEFFAFWGVHEDAFKLFQKYDLHPQIWHTLASPAEGSSEDMIEAAAASMEAIAKRTAELGCKLGLYNHGGWGGEPKNLVAVCSRLKEKGYGHVGIVYNWHHGHGHIVDWAESLALMQPYLICLNLNGMNAGEQPKILPLGLGAHDLAMLKTVVENGYDGPVGILNHTSLDARLRLQDNLDGLQWLVKQLDGSKAGAKPQYRTWSSETDDVKRPAVGAFPGKVFAGSADYRRPPITVECQATLRQQSQYNILVACDTKQSGDHWELFSMAGTGRLTAYFPGRTPDHIRSDVSICDGQAHRVAMILESDRARLFVDGKQVAEQQTKSNLRPPVPGQLAVGRLVEGGLGCSGGIDWVRLSRGARTIVENNDTKVQRDDQTIELWTFDNTAGHVNLKPIVVEYDPEWVASLSAEALQNGAAERGVALFAHANSACLSCHKIGNHGGTVGPELTNIGRERTPHQIVESIFWPKREVKPEYTAVSVLTADGRVVSGYQVESDTSAVVLKDPATGKLVSIPDDDVEEQVVTGTLMPDGATAAMSHQQHLDLIHFLVSLGRDDGPSLEMVNTVLAHAHAHAPASFEFDRRPLQPGHWPSWQHHVNRDRVYDFYAKQAEYFRTRTPTPALLSPFPGLDGGTYGHWGNQNEETWAGDEWNDSLPGSVQCGVFRAAGVTVPRAVCLRLGEDGELSACFNPDTLTYDAIWTGGFVKYSSVRHGFVGGLTMDGTVEPRPEIAKPSPPWEYHGFYRHGKRAVFAYRIGDTEYLDAPWVEDGHFVRTVAAVEEHPLRHLMKPGPPQWPEKLETKILIGDGRPYAVDTIELPKGNPWKTPLFCGGHDFLGDGSALVCTMQGDVWHVSGLTDDSKPNTDANATAVWRRFASGLHHALGLVVNDSGVFVLGRDQLTRLHDLNDDGEADFYECFSNAFETSAAGHDFICGLQQDANGNFYTASGNQGVLRISADGRRADVIATGFRNPDGIGLNPDGFLTVPCSEGSWTPSSMICEVPLPNADSDVTPAPYYGFGGPRGGSAPQLPLVYLPRGVDNSSGGQAFVASDRWGPLSGKMIHTSFGTGSHFLLLRDEVDGWQQGAVVPLPGEFRSGAHRARFNPRDGQLYVTGMNGWGSYTPDDGCFERVRYTGDRVQLPVAFHVHENGLSLTFSQPLDASVTAQPQNHFAQCWNYRYSGAYGSPEFSTRHPGVRGHDVLPIRSAHVLSDGHRLFLEMPDLQPVNQLHLRLGIGEWGIDMFLTVHRLGSPFTKFPGYQPLNKTIAIHPIEADLTLAALRVPNPWRKAIAGATPVQIETGPNLTFVTRSLTVKAGEPIRFTLVNPDVVPHNWVLVKPDALRRVGEASNQLVADPAAFARHYVPLTDDVLAYTDIVPPQSEFTIYFDAPQTPGRYPYLCTFPGHWMVMNGELLVE